MKILFRNYAVHSNTRVSIGTQLKLTRDGNILKLGLSEVCDVSTCTCRRHILECCSIRSNGAMYTSDRASVCVGVCKREFCYMIMF